MRLINPRINKKETQIIVASVIVTASDQTEKILMAISRSRKESAADVQRAKIFLRCAEGVRNVEIAAELGIHVNTVSMWRQRFARADELLRRVEAENPEILPAVVREILQDAERSGAPGTFTPEQKIRIIDLSCTPPKSCGRELSHWTCAELAEAAAESGIVKSISPASVWRILDAAELKPWKSQYWLNSPEKKESPKTFNRKVKRICRVYRKARRYAKRGYRVITIDEMTGVQALERRYKDLPPAPGRPWRREFEYIRHGTISAIVAMDVATGVVFAPYLNETRTEADFAAAIRAIIATDPDAGWIIVCDGLNTHKSETLVRLIAELCGIEADLGRKGVSGILATMASRAAFLGDERHRIYFLYTPAHCSWVNQIEIFFSAMSRKLLKKSSYGSTAELTDSIVRFIEQYNVTARPYKWTYTGKPLAA